MDEQTYQGIQKIFRDCKGKRDYLKRCKEAYNDASDGTLLSIYSQAYQQLMKRELPKCRKPNFMDELYHRYLQCANQGSTLLIDMSQECKLSAVLFARIILEKIAQHQGHAQEGWSGVVSEWIRDPHQIEPLHLREQVIACIECDSEYGPLGERLKHSIGREHELLLAMHLRHGGIVHMSEDEMRKKSFDKTPDFKLDHPILVSGSTVHWIESKAMFGDEDIHTYHLDRQLRSYVNRFGSGMVIYWYGYHANLSQDDSILIRDSFNPQEVINTLLH